MAFLLLHKPGNVSHPSVDFTTSTVNPPPPKPQPVSHFLWPFYGGDATRTHFLSNKLGLRFKVGWKFEDYVLLEFPPVMSGTTLYLLDNYGSAKAIDAHSGHKLWETKAGTLAAASPALDSKDKIMFVPLLSVSRGANLTQRPGNGAIKALSMRTGHILWSRPVPPGSESSPLESGGIVYTGSQNGTVYALQAKTGKTVWIYHASGAVKGGPSLAGGTVYFGDYAGRMYALNARTGHPRWVVGTSGTAFGFGSGTFYSSPAIAFGRIYIGNTDNFVYSFSARTGQLAWRTGTGNYIYSSPAVENTPGLGPTVYIGSYDGTLYALDARSGAVRWRRSTGGAIDGSPQIIGGVVYVSGLRTRRTYGIDARTGKIVFTFPDGRFNPGISDGHALYLTGYSKLYQLLPVTTSKNNARRTKR